MVILKLTCSLKWATWLYKLVDGAGQAFV